MADEGVHPEDAGEAFQCVSPKGEQAGHTAAPEAAAAEADEAQEVPSLTGEAQATPKGVGDEAATPPAVLRLRGVPFAASESNIMQFFAGAENVQQPTEVYICRRNGEAVWILRQSFGANGSNAF